MRGVQEGLKERDSITLGAANMGTATTKAARTWASVKRISDGLSDPRSGCDEDGGG